MATRDERVRSRDRRRLAEETVGKGSEAAGVADVSSVLMRFRRDDASGVITGGGATALALALVTRDARSCIRPGKPVRESEAYASSVKRARSGEGVSSFSLSSFAPDSVPQ